MAFVWEFQPGFESQEEHVLFWRWVRLGADHGAQRRLASQERRPYAELDDLRRRKLWPDRFAAWDAHLAREARTGLESQTEIHTALLERLRKALHSGADLVGVELDDLASAALRTGRGGTMKPAEAVKATSILADAAIKLAPPPEAQATTGGVDVSRLSLDEQLTFRRLTAKMRGED